MSFGAVLGFCCADRCAVLTIRGRAGPGRAGTPGERGRVGMRELERTTARRSELDTLVAQLAKRLQEAQAEREELVIAGS
ncbi:hypothetical protein ACIHCQ_29595 [Streptomyces sp. NPDC052236]|uniref:hypothetical protein n=1 Tax=Streptomyces sp. NPDC052236 TaxID=3365686 RepID=UPI0037D55D1E